MKNNIIALLAVSVLASCGGSGTGGSGTGGIVDADFAALVASANDIISRSESLEDSLGFTPFVEVGAAAAVGSGTAIYDGYAILDESGSGNGAVGSFNAIANFATLNVEGTASEFFDTAGRVPGSFTFDLDIRKDVGSPAAIVVGTWNGSLTWSDGSELLVNNAALGGEFRGDDLEALDFNTNNGNLRVVGIRQP